MVKRVCLHGVDDHHLVAVDVLLRVVVGDDQEVVADGPHQEVEDGDLLQAVEDSADHLLNDVVHCCLLLMEEDYHDGLLEQLAGLLNLPSTQPVGPTIHQISFSAFRCTAPAVVGNDPG